MSNQDALLQFDIALHRRPERTYPGMAMQIDGVMVEMLMVVMDGGDDALPVEFETAEQQLGQLPRMFCEPDGSFVWTGEQGPAAWQVDGQFYDRYDQVQYVELKGNCPRPQFQQLLACFATTPEQSMYRLIHGGIFVDWENFLKVSEGAAGNNS